MLLLVPLLALLEAAPVETPAAPSEKGEARPGPAGLEVRWARTWDEAAQAARKIPNGRILISFVDRDCGQCQRMDALILPSTDFFAFTRDKVPVRLSLSSPEGASLARRLRVPGVPAWYVVTPDLVICGAQVGPTTQMGWVETFSRAEQGWFDYKKKLEEEAGEPRNDSLVFEVARETFRRGGDQIAEPRFRRLAASSRVALNIREQCLAYLATIEMDGSRFPEARRDLDELLRIGKDPAILQRAEMRRAELDIALGRKDLAARRLRAFKQAHPGSDLVRDADDLLRRLGVPESANGGDSR